MSFSLFIVLLDNNNIEYKGTNKSVNYRSSLQKKYSGEFSYSPSKKKAPHACRRSTGDFPVFHGID
jgi:hypothetical protein